MICDNTFWVVLSRKSARLGMKYRKSKNAVQLHFIVHATNVKENELLDLLLDVILCEEYLVSVLMLQTFKFL